MNTETRALLVVVTEAAIEQRLLDDLERLGAPGWTVTDVRGRGSRGRRDTGWEPDRNIRVEVICRRDLAETIAAHLREHYYDDYAMVLTLADVEVLRPAKF